jgi:hypothetical protein
LVAKGFHQQAGLDYDETFSPIIKPPTVRIILSLAAHHRWSLRQLDVSNAFLHGFLKEDVFMQQPPGYVDSAFPTLVCKLHKSLYGLKQAPRAWFERFTRHLLAIGFCASVADPSLFVFRRNGVVLYLLLYVDDIILTGNSSFAITDLISQLASNFELKDLGLFTIFSGYKLTPLPVVCLFIKENISLIYFQSFTWLIANLLPLPLFLLRNFLLVLVMFFLILHLIEVWLVLCYMLPLLALISHLPLIMSASSCTVPLLFILWLPSASFVI